MQSLELAVAVLLAGFVSIALVDTYGTTGVLVSLPAAWAIGVGVIATVERWMPNRANHVEPS
jgi:hypothetical protein